MYVYIYIIFLSSSICRKKKHTYIPPPGSPHQSHLTTVSSQLSSQKSYGKSQPVRNWALRILHRILLGISSFICFIMFLSFLDGVGGLDSSCRPASGWLASMVPFRLRFPVAPAIDMISNIFQASWRITPVLPSVLELVFFKPAKGWLFEILNHHECQSNPIVLLLETCQCQHLWSVPFVLASGTYCTHCYIMLYPNIPMISSLKFIKSHQISLVDGLSMFIQVCGWETLGSSKSLPI